MTDPTRYRIHTGTDPRTLTEYALLRDEINKLSHPARPDVDWAYAEKLCLSLFEQNGVELQSAAWYTLARTHSSGLSGLNEGLNLLEALVLHQWSALWPQALQTRTEILSALSRRLQAILRGWSFQSNHVLPELAQTEQLLLSLRDALTRYGMRDAGQTGMLYQQVKYTLSRLQDSAPAAMNPVMLEEPVAPPAAQVDAAPRVYVIQSEPEIQVEIREVMVRPSGLKPFIAGACCALLAGTLVLGGSLWYWQQDQQKNLQAGQEQQSLQMQREAIPLERLDNWYQGMSQLQQLTAQLNGLDKQRGKYLTVSELKSAVFSATESFNRHIPVEEQLRRYAVGEGNQLNEQTQTGLLLKQLDYRYQLLKIEKQAH